MMYTFGLFTFIVTDKRKFQFRRCGWSNMYYVDNWTADDKAWIDVMNVLFKDMFGQHNFQYTYVKGQGTKVSEASDPRPTSHTAMKNGKQPTRLKSHLLSQAPASSSLSATLLMVTTVVVTVTKLTLIVT